MANYKRPTFTGLQSKVDTKGLRTNSLLSLQSRATISSSGQLNHQMPNIKGVKHKVDTKGTDLTKLPPSPVKSVHQGLPYKRAGQEIRPKVSTWRYYHSDFEPNSSFTILPSMSTQTVELKDFTAQINANTFKSTLSSSFQAIRKANALNFRNEVLEEPFYPDYYVSHAHIQTDETVSLDSGIMDEIEEKVTEENNQFFISRTERLESDLIVEDQEIVTDLKVMNENQSEPIIIPEEKIELYESNSKIDLEIVEVIEENDAKSKFRNLVQKLIKLQRQFKILNNAASTKKENGNEGTEKLTNAENDVSLAYQLDLESTEKQKEDNDVTSLKDESHATTTAKENKENEIEVLEEKEIVMEKPKNGLFRQKVQKLIEIQRNVKLLKTLKNESDSETEESESESDTDADAIIEEPKPSQVQTISEMDPRPSQRLPQRPSSRTSTWVTSSFSCCFNQKQHEERKLASASAANKIQPHSESNQNQRV